MSGRSTNKALIWLIDFLKRLMGMTSSRGGGGDQPPEVDRIYFKGKDYPAESQAEIEDPCRQLFQQRQAVTSGRLQLIGLGKIKQSMGSTWDALQPKVYEITEQVIKRHVAGDDVFIRYKDDTYVIIFSKASYEEGEKKSTIIVDEIKQRLFDTNDRNLQDIEIQKDVIVFKTEILADKPLNEALDMMFTVFKTKLLTESEPVEIASPDEDQAESEEQEIMQVFEMNVECVDCAYLPLWDVKQELLTSYLILPRDEDTRRDIFSISPAPNAGIDLSVLKTVQVESRKRKSTGKQPLIICPVQHETLYRQESYKKYALLCQNTPYWLRKQLLFYITNPLRDLQAAEAFGFVPLLKKYGCQVLIEIPAGRETDFAALLNAGIDAIAVRAALPAPELKSLAAQAKASGISRIFAYDVDTKPLASSAVAAGLDCLGGIAVFREVDKPDVKYLPEDILAGQK